MSLYSSLTQVLAPFAARLNGLLTGYDGTVYSTPGEAVRTQINDLHVLIGHVPGQAIDASAVAYNDSNVAAELTDVNGRLSNLNKDLKSQIDDNFIADGLLLDTLCSFKAMTISGQPEGWRLKPDGYSEQNADYKLVKYAVTAGSIIRVISDDMFQFQNDVSVPSSGTKYRIGKTYGEFDGLIVVPAGATYIIFSTLITNGLASASKMVYDGVVPFWNNSKGGIYIDGTSIKTNNNGFGLYIDGKGYYVAPTDQSTAYTFTGNSGVLNALVIDKTKLTNVNARNNPNTVMSIVSISGSNFAIDPKYEIVAIWYKSFWSFYGVFQYFCDYLTSAEIDEKISNAISSADATTGIQINPDLYLFNLCSHRGLATQRNNTMAAFEAARLAGYKFVECDLRFTSDGVCVLYHDGSIDGTSISSMTYDQLHAIADYIPRLTDLLLLVKKNHLVIELDCAGRVNSTSIQSVYATCEKYGMLNSVVFCGYESELLYLANNSLTSTSVCVSFLNSTPTQSDIQSIDAKIRKFKFRMCSFNKDYISNTLIETAHAEGYNVQAWTLTEQTEAQEMFEIGVDTLLCDASTLWEIN